jgi:UPF0176 protein
VEYPITITASYAFFPLSEQELQALHEELLQFGKDRGMRGLVLIAREGINSTVCGTPSAIAEWKERLRKLEKNIVFKDSGADALVFRRWSVKLKKEIVTIRKDDIHPHGPHRHLTPEEWKEMIKRDDVVVLDTRNHYEIEIGKFKGAVDPGIRHFREFPEFVQKTSLPKDKKVLMYCTGGIRCEKALLAMEAEGFKDVYQLEGGILAYLEKFPHEDFEGECFVFDKRVAVDQKLQPSSVYQLCYECGDPCVQGKCEKCCKVSA